MAIFNSYVNLPEGTPKKNVVENQHVAALNDKIVYCHIKHWCPQDWLDYQPVKVWIQPTNQVGRWNSNGGEYSQKNRKTAGGSNMFTFHGCIYIYIYDLFGGISNIDIVGFFAVTHFVGCHAIGRVVFAVSRWVKIITLSDSRGGWLVSQLESN